MIEETVTRQPGVPYADVFTGQASPITVADLADALTARGFIPGFTDVAGENAPLSEAGLAEAQFESGAAGYRVVSLSSSKGEGCVVSVAPATAEDLPDDYLLRRAVARPKLVYHVEGGSRGNSDRTLAENVAEALMILSNGAVWIGGLGVKGNKPQTHTTRWLGAIRH